MYEKPSVQRYGTLRELTLIGPGANGDGGIWGIGWCDGSPAHPSETSGRS